MKKRIVIALLVVMAMLVMACNGGTTPPAEDNDAVTDDGGAAATDDVDTDDDTADTAQPPADGEEVELIMSSWANTGEIAVLSRAVDLFNERNVGVAQVEFRNLPGENYEEVLLTQLAGGVAPDVFYAGEGTVARLIANQNIAELTDFMWSDSSYVSPDDFADGLWGPARVDGRIYGITVDCNPVLLYFSPVMFEELGIENPNDIWAAGNWDFNAWDRILQELVDNDMMGFIHSPGNIWQYSIIYNFGGSVWNNDEYIYDDLAREAVHWLNDRIQSGLITISTALPMGQGADASFISGTVGFISAGRWHTPTFVEAGIDFDYVPLPNNLGTPYGNTWIATAYMCVNAESENLYHAKRFATFFTSAEGQSARLGGGEIGNAIPSVFGIDDDIIATGVPVHVEHLFGVRDNGWANGGDLVPSGQLPGFNIDVQAIFEDIFVNNADVDEAIARLEEVGARLIAQYR